MFAPAAGGLLGPSHCGHLRSVPLTRVLASTSYPDPLLDAWQSRRAALLWRESSLPAVMATTTQTVTISLQEKP